MTHCFKFLTAATLALSAIATLHAQGLTLSPSASLIHDATLQRPVDFIVALVNSEPITHTEVLRETQRVLQQLALQQHSPPDNKTLKADVLEGLINKKWQLQLARDMGIRVEEAAIDQAEQSIAAQNQANVTELRHRIETDGLSLKQFRSQLRDQIVLQRLREREVAAHVKVSELDIDAYLREQQTNPDLSKLQLNLAQIVIPIPENATHEQVQAIQVRAEKLLQRARAGKNFEALGQEMADTSFGVNGAPLGLRSADRYPSSFVSATRQLSAGDVAELVRSPSGFHILKVIEINNLALPSALVTQSHVRHILLRPSASLTDTDVRAKLSEFKNLMLSGRAEFARLAHDYSQDGSAIKGGDLGWASPGMFVPEFEAVIDVMKPGDISNPVASRFGMHLIQLLERRQSAVSTAQQREMVRAMVRDIKLEDAYKAWAQTQRARAFIELREEPQ